MQICFHCTHADDIDSVLSLLFSLVSCSVLCLVLFGLLYCDNAHDLERERGRERENSVVLERPFSIEP